MITPIGIVASSLKKITPVSDADAQAFIDVVVGEGNALTVGERTKINDFVSGMKTSGIWTKCRAIYPVIGSTESAHKYNLKDPQDLDSSFRLTFPNGATHENGKIEWNGTNQEAVTYFNAVAESLPNNSSHLSYYTDGQVSNDSNGDLGYIGTGLFYFQSYYFGQIYYSYGENDVAHAGGSYTTDGFWVGTRTPDDLNAVYKNGDLLQAVTDMSSASGDGIVSIGQAGGAYTGRNFKFASIGEGLTESEVGTFSTLVHMLKD